jgi:hypothetical protein
MNTYRKLFWVMLVIPFLLLGNAIAADNKTPSATLVIDETQVDALIGGDFGGGTLLFGDNSYSFKTKGLKLGSVGVHKIHLVGKVYHLNDVADFPGDYFVAEIGGTVDKLDKEGLWLKNTKGVTLHMKSSAGKGLELGIGVEGFKIKMK